MLGSWMSSFDKSNFDDFAPFEEEMDRMFDTLNRTTGIRAVRRGSFPQVNIGASPERVDVYLFGAGLDPKTVDISIEKSLLAVSGSREVPTREGGAYYRRERFGGDFRRVVSLPEDVDPEHADANYRDGVLHITVPRRESVRPRQIEVR